MNHQLQEQAREGPLLVVEQRCSWKQLVLLQEYIHERVDQYIFQDQQATERRSSELHLVHLQHHWQLVRQGMAEAKWRKFTAINFIGLLVGIDCMGASGGFGRREGPVKPGADQVQCAVSTQMTKIVM